MKKPPGKWAMNHDRCTTCGQNDRPYFSQGKCQRCYFAEYGPANLEKIKAHKRKWYAKVGGKNWAKVQREQRNFDNLRQSAIDRDGGKCVVCGSSEKLTVHHKDGHGRGDENPHNTLDNLETLCRAHHMIAHKVELARAKASRLSYWAPKYKLNACRACGRNAVKHQGNGFCVTCRTRQLKSGAQKLSQLGAPCGKWN